MKLRSLLITLPLVIIALALALANRRGVILSLDPFDTVSPRFAVEMPLFIALFGALIIGMLIGGAVAWTAGFRRRRVLKRSVRIMQRDLAAARTTEPVKTEAAKPAETGTALTVHGSASLPTSR